MNYLSVNVYTSGYGDCSNGGITARQPERLVVPCVDGHLTEENVRDSGYTILVPAEKGGHANFVQEGEKRWTMFGGNYVCSSDSRFGQAYGRQPIAVHDRIE